MNFFFEPRGIAMIGASSNALKGGYSIVKNVMNGFSGGIYPVNPQYTEIEGLPCYSSILEVPDPVDLAIIFVPSHLVPQTVRECAQRGVKGVMIESAGFAEVGDDGKNLQETLKQVVRETGIRVWGPNCMGLIDTMKGYVFSFVDPVIWEEGLRSGPVSLIVQSGMLSGAFLIDIMSHGIMGVSKVCSIGNKADVDECDLLEYLIHDPDTGAVGLYLESIPDGRRFIDLCRGTHKPIVVLKGGKSERGAAAAMSHTASLAGDGGVVSGALAQAGVVEAKAFRQMMDLCQTLATYPKLKIKGRPRVAVITFTGGAGIVSSDLMDKLGIEIADLTPATREQLKTVFPEWMPVANPVDIYPAIERNGADKAYGAAIKAVCADPNVDAVLLHCFTGGLGLGANIFLLAEEARPSKKPVFCWLLGKKEEAREFHMNAQRMGIPVYRGLNRAVECMHAAFEHAGSLRHRKHSYSPENGFSLPESALRILDEGTGGLDEYLSKQIFAACRIPVVEETIVSSSREAQTAALDLGLPVVLKGLAAGQLHKTELGLVRMGISSPADAEHCFDFLTQAMNGKGKVLMQKQVPGGLELIAGLIRDPQFGPCVMCGLGGVMAEILNDVVFALAPLSRREGLAMIGRLKSQKLLDGFRGSAPLDREALADILVQLGHLGHAYPRIREIDINPLIVNGGSPIAVDGNVVLGE